MKGWTNGLGLNSGHSPCKDCDKRRPLCHSECSEYLDYKTERDRVYKIRKDYIRLRDDLDAVRKTGMTGSAGYKLSKFDGGRRKKS